MRSASIPKNINTTKHYFLSHNYIKKNYHIFVLLEWAIEPADVAC